MRGGCRPVPGGGDDAAVADPADDATADLTPRPNLWPMFSSLARIGVPVMAGVLLLGLSSCGDDDNSATVSTVQIRPSSYSIKEPVTTTTVPTSAVADAQGRSPAEQTFIVKTNKDVPFNIAKLYDIKLDELRNY